MEPRIITVATTKNSKTFVIESSATTLGELKVDFDKAGIDYANQTFYEGTTKTEFKSDETILPTNIPFKGTVTNDLVILITTMDKKIESGVETRAEAVNYIKSKGLTDLVKNKFGKNYTNCSNNDLINFVNKHLATSSKPTSPHVCQEEHPKKAIAKPTPQVVKEEVGKEKIESSKGIIEDAIINLVQILVDRNTISTNEANSVLIKLGAPALKGKEELKSPYSQGDLNNMFAFVKR